MRRSASASLSSADSRVNSLDLADARNSVQVKSVPRTRADLRDLARFP